MKPIGKIIYTIICLGLLIGLFVAQYQRAYLALTDSRHLKELIENLKNSSPRVHGIFIPEIKQYEGLLLKRLQILYLNSDSRTRVAIISAMQFMEQDHVSEILMSIGRYEKDTDIAIWAISILMKHDIKVAMPIVTDKLNGSWQSDAKRWLLFWLGRNPGKLTLQKTEEYLESDDPTLRSGAVWAYTDIARKDAYPKLIKMISDPDDEVKIAIADALSLYGDSTITNDICELLNDDNSSVRISALFALSRIGSKEAVGPIINRLSEALSISSNEDSLGNVRADPEKELDELIYTLGYFGGDSAFHAIMEALDDKRTMQFAADALSEFDDKRAVAPLLGILNRLNNEKIFDSVEMRIKVKRAVINTLGRIGDQRAVDPIINLLEKGTENEDVKESAILALGRLGSPKAIPAIKNVLKDSASKSVILYCKDALKQLGVESNTIPHI
ncbi:MAG: hypothetical protein GF310_00390 [candidate division Zixibacteria bacterium]|nr:hypothetical protein [candidate division Zixibacteria bacterium]